MARSRSLTKTPNPSIRSAPQQPSKPLTANTLSLTPAQIEAFGKEMDAIRERVLGDLGQRDADYIRDIVKLQRGLEIAGRAMLQFGWLPPAFVGGVAALGASKILDNMEIGHNVMHGQYDWMQDPQLNSRKYDWDTACPADQWRHSHNVMHHTYTNVLGVDRDVGYGLLRMDENQPWHPIFLANPVFAFLLASLFQYGVALHDAEFDRILSGERPLSEAMPLLKGIWKKTRGQWLKDYALFPLLAGPGAPITFVGNAMANLVRNYWTFTIIFCGHFPADVQTFDKSTLANETRGQWYLRQLLGSANIEGGKWFHIFSGNLSHQIEHHLFPDLPAHRYAEMSVEVRKVCEKFGLPYNTGSLRKQFGSVVAKIFKLALPPRSAMLPVTA
ncbi:Fatty acid desaturase [Hydrocarboniphaga daqingensis]|uniref:Fatty acid desaturase n=1 Tax=Hydrocarboniphaga daqingensis TaxID=490188 RepID=A0A1M5KAR3_9GAMM|nr:acyl-CoA desaturase [Hydrocarboniphaga daqingensis]SHG49882.1 Fatty acid desaturase [Hydrocarboniphaga daqingensis]